MKFQDLVSSTKIREPLVESPTSVYLAGLSIGIGCGALVLLLLLGAALSV